jgi:pepF/M3 family oligoendopeptidase
MQERLPHWDTTTVYPGLDAAEFARGFAEVVAAIGDLGERFDEYGVGRREPAALDDATVRAFDQLLTRYNDLLEEVNTLATYINCFVTTNSRDDTAQARYSELQRHLARLTQLGTRFTAWVGSLDIEPLIERSAAAQMHAFALRTMQHEARHQLSPAEEELAAELNLSGGAAWGKLHGNVSSQLSVQVEVVGEPVELPMSAARNLAYDPDRDTRRRAHEAELAAWQSNAVPLAASMNGIKGQVLTLETRRGWHSPLDKALFDNRIDRATLDAMLGAARESFPDFRRYLRAKSRALGLPALAWYDIFAPVGASSHVWSFPAARDFIVEQFGTYSERLADFAARAFDERWIDAEPRPGKRDGAFCTSLRGDESRILANFKPSYAGVSTLAHELGHGYHNLCKAAHPPLARVTPMTLAETASIFCETIVRQAALARAEAGEALTILEASLQGSCQVVVDITSRFLFEQRVFEIRRGRELSVDELNQLMLDSQRETYGDGLAMDTLHPYMWAVKPHYYSPGRSFYNYPYMFGLLFGLGLYAQYQSDPDSFRAGFDDLLASTGQDDAASLAARFGIDIRTPDFWRASLDVIRADIARFEALA